MTQDLYYYEAGYTDDNYFVYTADAESLEAGTFAMTAACGVIRAASVSLTSSFSQTASIIHIEGFDLFVFSNIQLAAQVSVIKGNNIAVTSAFTQVTSGARIRYVGSDQTFNASITVDNLRVRYIQAAANAAFSLTVDSKVNKPTSASISSNASLTASTSIGKKSSSSLLSNFTVSVTGSIVGKRPRLLTAFTNGTGSLSFNGSDKILGTHSLQIVSTSSTNRAYYASEFTKDFVIAANQDFIIEFYYKPTAVSSTGTWSNLVSAQPSGLANPYWSIQLGGTSPRTISFEYLYTFDNGTSQVNRLTGNLIGTDYEVNQWHYVSASRVNGVLSLKLARKNVSTGVWSTPTTIASDTISSAFGPYVNQPNWSQDSKLYVGDPVDKRSSFLIDELYMATGTGVSQQFKDGSNPNVNVSGGEPETQFLFHWDNNTVDDMTGVKEFISALTSTASLSVSVGKSVVAASAISSTATVNVIVGKIQPGAASLQANGFVTAAFGRIRPFIDIQAATFTATINGTVVRSAASAQTSNVTVSASGTRTIGPILAALTAAASQTTTGNIVTGNSASLTANGFLISAFGRIRPEVADLTSAFSLTVDGFVGKIASAALTATTSVAAQATRTVGPISASLSSSTAISVQAVSIPSGSIAMVSATTVSASGNRIRYSSAQLTTTATVAVTAKVTRSAGAGLTTTASISATALRIKQLSSAFAAIATEINIVNKIGRTLIDCSVTSTMTTTAKVVSGQSAFMTATTQVQASVKVTKPFRSTMSSTTAMVVEGFTGIIGEADLTSQSTLACAPTKRASARAATQSNFSLSANLGATRRFISLEMSSGTLTATANLVKNAPAALASTATLFANGSIIKLAQADLHCDGFILADGTVINLEASATWIVPKEITLWTVPVENREYIVEFEQRSFTIKG